MVDAETVGRDGGLSSGQEAVECNHSEQVEMQVRGNLLPIGKKGWQAGR